MDERRLLGVAALYEQVARAVYEERGPRVLQPAQWSALRYFARAGSEARTVTGLARFLGVTMGPASRAVAALEKRGLLASRPHPRDRRSSLFDLTDAGQDKVRRDPLARLARALAEVDAADRNAFARVVVKLAETLGAVVDPNASPPPRSGEDKIGE